MENILPVNSSFGMTQKDDHMTICFSVFIYEMFYGD